MEKISALKFFLLFGLVQPVFADNWCSDNPNPYQCDVNKPQGSCVCYIRPSVPGDTGSWSMRFFPIEKEKYECTFKMSPLSLFVNSGGSYFPEGVKYQYQGADRGNEVKMDIDATNMKLNDPKQAYVEIKFDFGAYDAPSVLSGFCIKK